MPNELRWLGSNFEQNSLEFYKIANLHNNVLFLSKIPKFFENGSQGIINELIN